MLTRATLRKSSFSPQLPIQRWFPLRLACELWLWPAPTFGFSVLRDMSPMSASIVQ